MKLFVFESNLITLSLLFLLICRSQSTVPIELSQEDRPNIIMIFADDIGWGDLSCTGHPYSETPNLCRLAKEGTTFTNFYVTGNVCHHSRTGIMTSRNPSWFPNKPYDYSFMGAKTLTNLLNDTTDYHTGHLGKWHIGPDPEVDAVEYGILTAEVVGSDRNDPMGREGLRFTKAIEFVEDHKDEPFYLNLWIYATHTPVNPADRFVRRYEDLEIDYSLFDGHMMQVSDDTMHKYLADLYSMDLNVGRLLDKLDEFGLAQNTLVAFSSDNGPEGGHGLPPQGGYAGGLREGKHSYYDGGIRVPFLVRWPSKIPANHVNDQSIISSLDWLPTVCSLAGCDIQREKFEGEDMSDVFLGLSDRSRTDPIFWRAICEPLDKCIDRVYMRYGKWKFHKKSKELYDLTTDLGERNNVYENYPGVVAELNLSMEVWEASLPTVQIREPAEPIPWDPTVPVAEVYLPLVPGVHRQPTISPVPTLPPAPTPSPPTQGPSKSAAPTASSPELYFNPKCQIFRVPFDAEADAYCDYEDRDLEHFGNCGSGPVDMKRLSATSAEYCQGTCAVAYTKVGEYVEYHFSTSQIDSKVIITVRVSSLRRKQFWLELVNENLDSGILNSPGSGWEEYQQFSWVTTIPNSGTHKIRIVFIDGGINLCSLSIHDDDNMAASPTTSPDAATIPTEPPTNPHCQHFVAPFQAKAQDFCGYEDMDREHLGNCGSGPIDMKKVPETANDVCSDSDCAIAFTEPGEYVDYRFFTTEIDQVVQVTVGISSSSSTNAKTLRLELDEQRHNGDDNNVILYSPALGWDEYKASESWLTTIPEIGFHKLRVVFESGRTNLCSIRVDVPSSKRN